ncbi:MAG TPA: carboxymuconolactone decarboxylase family protein [Burkholderiaceae bacterium]|nr:carboxymuconolactone decarboxylase family protein [Burkholderiaceae bacterium]
MKKPPGAGLDPELLQQAIGPYAADQPSLEARSKVYADLLGFVPPRVQARLHVTGALDPTMVDLQERARSHAMDIDCFEPKIVQLMIFGMLMVELSDAATMHAIAARRAGASWQELQAVINMAYVFRGVSAANRGADILAEVARREAS